MQICRRGVARCSIPPCRYTRNFISCNPAARNTRILPSYRGAFGAANIHILSRTVDRVSLGHAVTLGEIGQTGFTSPRIGTARKSSLPENGRSNPIDLGSELIASSANRRSSNKLTIVVGARSRLRGISLRSACENPKSYSLDAPRRTVRKAKNRCARVVGTGRRWVANGVEVGGLECDRPM